MNYDFETLVKRDNGSSSKWNLMYEKCPNVPADVVPLSVADMEIKTAPEIVNALKAHIEESILGYSVPNDEYKDAVISWMKRRHNWDINGDWIVPYSGIVPALYPAILGFTEPGDGIIIMTPVYYPFSMAIKDTGREIVENKLIDNGEFYEIDFADFEEKAKNPKTKMLIMCNPHNPVGRVWTREELEKLGKICLENDIFVVSDEIHFDLIMPGYTQTVMTSISDEFEDRWITCTAPSKTFNLAGMQTSNIIIKNEEIRQKYIDTAASFGIRGTNSLGLIACQTAYNECEAWLDELIKLIDSNAKLCENFMRENIPEIKVRKLEGTYLQWWDCNELNMDCDELEDFMINKAYLFLDEGYIFGSGGECFERINLACPTHVIEDSLNRLHTALKNR